MTLDDGIVFPIKDIVQNPRPGYGIPRVLKFSPDDSCVSYLFSPDESLNMKLFVHDIENNKKDLFFSPPGGGLYEANLSAEEKLRRERLRETGLGVTGYEWVKESSGKKLVIVPQPTGIYMQEFSGKPELKVSTASSSPIIDPFISPDGTMLAYVRDSELHALNLSSNETKQLTSGANGTTMTHGLAEYIAQEEMSRWRGYWWSLDSKFIAFTEVDSSAIPLFRIMHQGKDSVGPDAQEDHAYPFPGGANVKVRLGVVSASGGPVTWMDILCGEIEQGNPDDEYLARVHWMHGNNLVAQIVDRSHTKVKLLKFDIKTGQRKVILVEENDIWVNLHSCFTALEAKQNYPGGFLWASEKTGFQHLYIYDIDGVCLGAVTQGEWMVENVAGVNEASGLVYFSATLDGPTECHLYCAKIFPDPNSPLEDPKKLTQGKGKHFVVLDHGMQKFVDTFDSLTAPPKISLCSLHDGNVIMPLFEQSLSTKLPLEPPSIHEIQANDGTILYGALYKPDEVKFGPAPYKSMIQVYGGPDAQLVTNSWLNTVDMRAQYLRSRGILVWKMDNRGSSRRGLKFEGAQKHKFGYVDSEDQVTGVDWLIKQGLAKQGHIGMYGWSYGGYLSAISLSRYPEVFSCAVAGAPVTAWDGYDTFYTEKYMGLPSENASCYAQSSVMHHVGKLKGKLMIIHGMIDENVHFRHTSRLVNALIAAGKSYELLMFPDERHLPRRLQDRIYMEERIWEFIERNL